MGVFHSTIGRQKKTHIRLEKHAKEKEKEEACQRKHGIKLQKGWIHHEQ